MTPPITAADRLINPGPRAKVLLLGTFHFSNPGLDAYKERYTADMLAPEQQAQILEVVERLSAFAPTRIGVERMTERQVHLDSEYAAYRDGNVTLPTGEEYQIGFRLAAALDHERLFALDVWGRPYEGLEDFEDHLRKSGRDDLADGGLPEPFVRFLEQQDAHKASHTLREHLLFINDPDYVRAGHGVYFTWLFGADGDSGYAGVDFETGRWYNRNLRIFRNIQRITSSPQDRILVIYGVTCRSCATASRRRPTTSWWSCATT